MTMPELRPYQKRAVHEIEAGIAQGDTRLLFQLCTGAGKTVVAQQLIARRQGGHSIWLTPRQELIAQTAARLRDAGLSVTTASAREWQPRRALPRDQVVITTPQVFRNRDGNGQCSPADLLVIDEAHHSPSRSWQEIITGFPGSVVGLTATPWRLSRHEGFTKIFQRLINGEPPSRLAEQGYLAVPVVYTPAESAHVIQGGRPGRTGDYTAAGILGANRAEVMTTAAVRWWEKRTQGALQTIFYGVSQAHAANIAQELQERGYPAAAVTNRTPPAPRQRALAEFQSGALRCLVNVAIYTEGLDCAAANCIVITRPTQSLALYLQMAGRVTRPSGITPVILDATHSTHTHGLPLLDREWSLLTRESGGSSPPPELRQCPDCAALHSAAQQECPQCGCRFGHHCSRCGRWRPHSRWENGAAYCDYCTTDHQPPPADQAATAWNDGWAVSRRGNPYLNLGRQRAVIYREPAQNDAYVIFLNRARRQWRIHGRYRNAREAQRAAERELGVGAIMLQRRFRNCHTALLTAGQLKDAAAGAELLNTTSQQAAHLRRDIAALLPPHQQPNYLNLYEALVARGQATRARLQPSGTRSIA